jgi:hypothetical protein
MRDNVWPTEVEGFKTHLYGMFSAMDALGAKVLRGIARYLKLGDDFFADKVELGNSILRMLHYPPVAAGASGVRAGAHEDINVITLLLGAEEAGLQLKDADGEWLDIAPPPGALVVNIGDMLQRLTNHVLPSTSHRVINPAPGTSQLRPLFDALLPALQPGLCDRDAAVDHHAREPRPLRRQVHHGRGLPDGAAEGNPADLTFGAASPPRYRERRVARCLSARPF